MTIERWQTIKKMRYAKAQEQGEWRSSSRPVITPPSIKRSPKVSKLTVEEQYDRDGDLIFTVFLETHDRAALDRLAEVFKCDLSFKVVAKGAA